MLVSLPSTQQTVPHSKLELEQLPVVWTHCLGPWFSSLVQLVRCLPLACLRLGLNVDWEENGVSPIFLPVKRFTVALCLRLTMVSLWRPPMLPTVASPGSSAMQGLLSPVATRWKVLPVWTMENGVLFPTAKVSLANHRHTCDHVSGHVHVSSCHLFTCPVSLPTFIVWCTSLPHWSHTCWLETIYICRQKLINFFCSLQMFSSARG